MLTVLFGCKNCLLHCVLFLQFSFVTHFTIFCKKAIQILKFLFALRCSYTYLFMVQNRDYNSESKPELFRSVL